MRTTAEAGNALVLGILAGFVAGNVGFIVPSQHGGFAATAGSPRAQGKHPQGPLVLGKALSKRERMRERGRSQLTWRWLLEDDADDGPVMEDPEETRRMYSELQTLLDAKLEEAREMSPIANEDEAKPLDEEEERFDDKVYKELRNRRDFGVEQDLDLELGKRNITSEGDLGPGLAVQLLPEMTNSTVTQPMEELTPRQVLVNVMEALKVNDNPYTNHGIEVLKRFTAPSSVMYGIDLLRLASFISEPRNSVLLEWDSLVFPRPLVLMGKKKNRAYQPIKFNDRTRKMWHCANVYLKLDEESECWMIESIIVKGVGDI